jgi:succinate dehydrogenase/fumarate reductase-like Fe-S protein
MTKTEVLERINGTSNRCLTLSESLESRLTPSTVIDPLAASLIRDMSTMLGDLSQTLRAAYYWIKEAPNDEAQE